MSNIREDLNAGGGSQTVSRAMSVLRLVACGQELGMRLTDIVNLSGLNRPTVHRILKTLQAEEAIEQDPLSRRYRIGPEIVLLGIARTRRFPLLSAAGTHLAQLARNVGDTAFLTIRHSLDSICIGRETGHHPIQVLSIEVGARRPLGIGVSGVALMSCLPPDEAQAIMQANEKRLAFHDITPQILQERVETARATGYAYAGIGVMPHTRAVSVPVLSDAHTPLAALTITAMVDRLTPERLPEVVKMMQEQAQGIRHQYSEMQRYSAER